MMDSPFNPEQQNHSVDSKIIIALERIGEFFRVLLWNESKENNLTPIQIQILIFLRFHSQEMCKVSYLAREFNLTKATISDSVKTLLRKDLVEKQSSETDTRSFTIKLTKQGKSVAEKTSNFAESMTSVIEDISSKEKENTLSVLLTLIKNLNQQDIISIQRMCLTCAHYSKRKEHHFCSLLDMKLLDHQLRVDCPDHMESK